MSLSSLYESCAEVVSLCESMKEDLLAVLDPDTGFAPRLRDLCHRQLEELETGMSTGMCEYNQQVLDSLRLERNTWSLLQALIPARITQDPAPRITPRQMLSQNPYTTPSTLAQSVLANSPLLKELIVVREWLHETAYSPSLTHLGMSSMPEATTGYWKFTKVGIMQARRMAFAATAGGNANTPGGLVMEMDPDAVVRSEGAKSLAADDTGYEKNLMRTLYTYIRAGRIEDAAEVCEKAHQPWRSASIRGMRLFRWKSISIHDTTEDDDDEADEEDDADAWQGNRRRQLWKTTCMRLALNPNLSDAERVLYASLAPSPATYSILKKACRIWEDHLWAQISVVCEEKQVSEMMAAYGSGSGGAMGFWEGGAIVGPASTADAGRSMDVDAEKEDEEKEWEREVVNTLEGLRDVGVEDGPPADHAFHVSQLQIVLNRTPSLLEDFAQGLKDGQYASQSMQDRSQDSEYAIMCRFFAHLCLYLQMVDIHVPPDAVQVILEAYLSVLESSGHRTLIATYARSLGENAIERYSLFLSSLPVLTTTRKERKEALWRAKDVGLDVVAVAISSAERCVGKALEGLPSLKGPLPTLLGDREELERPPNESEMMLLRSIEWTIFMEETYSTALEQANVILRYFLATARVQLARELLGMLPPQLSAISEPEQTANEYLHYRQFFMLWEVLESVDAVIGGGVGEFAAPTGLDSRSGSAELNKQKELIDKAYELGIKLLTSEWLVSDVELPGGDRRRRELIRVRQIYIPELVIRIHFMLVNSRKWMKGNLKRTTELTDIVADSRYKLYEDFVAGDMSSIPGTTRRVGGKKLSDYLEAVRRAVICGFEDGVGVNVGGGGSAASIAGASAGMGPGELFRGLMTSA